MSSNAEEPETIVGRCWNTLKPAPGDRKDFGYDIFHVLRGSSANYVGSNISVVRVVKTLERFNPHAVTARVH
jgi:hypothetical protein